MPLASVDVATLTLLAFQMEDEDAALQQLEAFGKSNPAFAIDMVQSRAWLLASLERYDESLAYYDESWSFDLTTKAFSWAGQSCCCAWADWMTRLLATRWR